MRTYEQIGKWIGVASIVVFLAYAAAQSRVRPPNPTSVIGNWIGYDQDRLVFARLELKPDGKGWFCTTFVTNEARLYEVRKWIVRDFDLQIELVPRDKEAEPVYLKGVVEHPQLSLEIGGVDVKWRRSLTLFSEEDFLVKNQRVKERVAREKSEENLDREPRTLVRVSERMDNLVKRAASRPFQEEMKVIHNEDFEKQFTSVLGGLVNWCMLLVFARNWL